METSSTLEWTALVLSALVACSHWARCRRTDTHKRGVVLGYRRKSQRTNDWLTLAGVAIKRSEATRIEEELALALSAAGLRVKGGH
jgi:hypothetical protein